MTYNNKRSKLGKINKRTSHALHPGTDTEIILVITGETAMTIDVQNFKAEQ